MVVPSVEPTSLKLSVVFVVTGAPGICARTLLEHQAELRRRRRELQQLLNQRQLLIRVASWGRVRGSVQCADLGRA